MFTIQKSFFTKRVAAAWDAMLCSDFRRTCPVSQLFLPSWCSLCILSVVRKYIHRIYGKNFHARRSSASQNNDIAACIFPSIFVFRSQRHWKLVWYPGLFESWALKNMSLFYAFDGPGTSFCHYAFHMLILVDIATWRRNCGEAKRIYRDFSREMPDWSLVPVSRVTRSAETLRFSVSF